MTKAWIFRPPGSGHDKSMLSTLLTLGESAMTRLPVTSLDLASVLTQGKITRHSTRRSTLDRYHRAIADAETRDTPAAQRMRDVVARRRGNWE